MKAQNDNGKQTKNRSQGSGSKAKAADSKAKKRAEPEAGASLPTDDKAVSKKSTRKTNNTPSINDTDAVNGATEISSEAITDSEATVGNEAAVGSDTSPTASLSELDLSEALLDFATSEAEDIAEAEPIASSESESRESFVIPDNLFDESSDNSDGNINNDNDGEEDAEGIENDTDGEKADDAREINEVDSSAIAATEDGELEGDALSKADTEKTAEPADEIGESDTLFPADGEDAAEENAVSEADIDKTCEETKDEGAADEAADGGKADRVGKDDDIKEDEAKGSRAVDTVFDLIETLVFAIAAVFILITFFFRYSIVEGGSMDKTLADKQLLIISDFLYEPECGDIVVLHSTVLGKPIIKRVIAVGGQTVRITKTDIFVDGERLDEPYVHVDDRYISEMGEYFYSVYPDANLYPILKDQVDGEYYEILVPDGELFVLGDHRNDSLDSRAIGTVDEDSVIGKAVLRLYPFDKFGKIEE